MLKKWMSLLIAFISLLVGVIAAFIPLLPSFPFLLLTFILFSKHSKKITGWFMNSKIFKSNLESYVNGEGLTKQSKIKFMITITLTLFISLYFSKQYNLLTLLLGLIWLFHLYYFFAVVKTKKD